MEKAVRVALLDFNSLDVVASPSMNRAIALFSVLVWNLAAPFCLGALDQAEVLHKAGTVDGFLSLFDNQADSAELLGARTLLKGACKTFYSAPSELRQDPSAADIDRAADAATSLLETGVAECSRAASHLLYSFGKNRPIPIWEVAIQHRVALHRLFKPRFNDPKEGVFSLSAHSAPQLETYRAILDHSSDEDLKARTTAVLMKLYEFHFQFDCHRMEPAAFNTLLDILISNALREGDGELSLISDYLIARVTKGEPRHVLDAMLWILNSESGDAQKTSAVQSRLQRFMQTANPAWVERLRRENLPQVTQLQTIAGEKEPAPNSQTPVLRATPVESTVPDKLATFLEAARRVAAPVLLNRPRPTKTREWELLISQLNRQSVLPPAAVAQLMLFILVPKDYSLAEVVISLAVETLAAAKLPEQIAPDLAYITFFELHYANAPLTSRAEINLALLFLAKSANTFEGLQVLLKQTDRRGGGKSLRARLRTLTVYPGFLPEQLETLRALAQAILDKDDETLGAESKKVVEIFVTRLDALIPCSKKISDAAQ